jgi:hypothetical protein
MKISNTNVMNISFTSKATFFILLLFFSLVSVAQQSSFKEMLNITYSIQNMENIKNTKVYIDALNNANMNNHRLKSARNILQFEEGIKVVLFSAEEVLANGITNFNPKNFTNQIENYTPPVFRLADNNYIIELKQIVSSKSHQYNQ